MSKMSTPVAAALVAGLMVGPACSNSGLKSRAGDAGAASGGQAGSAIISGTTGGSGGTSGPGGAGGASIGATGGTSGPGGAGAAGTGGPSGSTGGTGACIPITCPIPACTYGALPNPDPCGCSFICVPTPDAGMTGDAGGSNRDGATAGSPGSSGTGGQGGTVGTPSSKGGQTGATTTSQGGTGGSTTSATATPPICPFPTYCNPGDQQVDGPCPAGRECYSWFDACGVLQCVVPEGVHCDVPLSCNPGDTPTTSYDEGCSQHPTACYTKQLCGQSIFCKHGTDAGVDASGKPGPDGSSQSAGAPHPQPCLPGEVLNESEMCPCVAEPSPTCPYSYCESSGDGWCHTQCTPPQQGGSCAGGFVCLVINIFHGGDIGEYYYLCDGPIGAPVGGPCRSSNDCNAGASCVTNTHCGDASVCPNSVCQN
jgi:hypothetical protein